MKKLLLALAFVTVSPAFAAPELTCAQAKAIALRCKAQNQPADPSHAELERALSGYFSCVEAGTGLPFREANLKFKHCR